MKPKKHTYYSDVVLKQSPYKKKQRAIKLHERLKDEKIYMKARYDSMFNKHRSKKKENLPKFGETPVAYNCYITWPEFWNAWEVHKKRHGGMYCAISGELMTHIGSNHPDSEKFSRNWNNISPDRLDPLKPYTLQNIIFVTWKINRQKNDFPLQYMKKLLQIYEDRFIDLKAIH
jgi:hypothetical protein